MEWMKTPARLDKLGAGFSVLPYLLNPSGTKCIISNAV